MKIKSDLNCLSDRRPSVLFVKDSCSVAINYSRGGATHKFLGAPKTTSTMNKAHMRSEIQSKYS